MPRAGGVARPCRLIGPSEDAQITALDWSAAIAAGDGKPAAGMHIILAHSVAAGA